MQQISIRQVFVTAILLFLAYQTFALIRHYLNRVKPPAGNKITKFGEFKPHFTEEDGWDWCWELITPKSDSGPKILVEGDEVPNSESSEFAGYLATHYDELEECLTNVIVPHDIVVSVFVLARKGEEFYFDVEYSSGNTHQMAYSQNAGFRFLK